MAYKFLDDIETIKADLSCKADAAKQELQEINSRQTALEADLAALEPQLLRTHSLKSRDDLICPECFILHNIESPLKSIPWDDHVDRFRCRKCDAEFELEI